MNRLELLAPARDIQIGIAAIDCGADAVYIAGPRFGARQAAGNEMEDIRQLCNYARRFGVNIFVTLNTILYDEELEDAWEQMMAIREAGADALIVQDLAVVEMARERGYDLPLHASTQCAVRTPDQARFLEGLGFSRLILERELSLEQIRAIREAVSCELEFFVHGALCVCYSGQCYLSEKIAGRSANRGACIQACRSLYDLVDEEGRVIVKNKALLSLKDYNLKERLEPLAKAGITSFKIEGRLKNESYVRNVVRDYSLALDSIAARRPSEFERGSFGAVTGGFSPDTAKTFNRGYTDLFIDGRRGRWASMDAAKSMGEAVGTVISVGRNGLEVRLNKGVTLNNGDGFSFVSRSGRVEGFRADVCSGGNVRCKSVPGLYVGAVLYRNIDTAFEKEILRNPCTRFMEVETGLHIGRGTVRATARSEDGRCVDAVFDIPQQDADNQERMASMICSQIGKTAGHYRFSVTDIYYKDAERLPFMSVSLLNSIRRKLAEELERIPCMKKDILHRRLSEVSEQPACPVKNVSYKYNVSNRLSEAVYRRHGAQAVEPAYEISHPENAELMRTRYCIRHELGLCPKTSGRGQTPGRLFLVNNGMRLALEFDCKNCEMIVHQVH